MDSAEFTQCYFISGADIRSMAMGETLGVDRNVTKAELALVASQREDMQMLLMPSVDIGNN